MSPADPAAPTLELTTFAWRLSITMLFVVLNGFFVAAEFALVKVRVSRLEALAAEGSARARTAHYISQHLDRYLSACQLGITISSLILGWLAEPAIAEALLAGAVKLGWEMAPTDPILHAVALGIALTIVTILHMTIGEQAPKIWAINRAESMSMQVSYPLRWFEIAFRPFIWLINELSNWLLRLAGMQSGELHDNTHSVDELRSILAASADSGQITSRQREFAQNILNIVGLEVRHILLPRVDVEYLSLQLSRDENVQRMRDSGHSRFPLCEVGLDTVVGIVHAKDIMSALVDGADFDLRDLSHKPVFVPDTQPLSRLILTLQNARLHSAVVLDERGTAIGMAFMEDALEEIVGPIHDEFDLAPVEVTPVAPGVVEVSGSLALPEAVDVLGLPPLGDEEDTIGGHVTAQLGRLPREGDEIEVGKHRLRVTVMDRHRIARLRVQAIVDDDAPEVENGGTP